MKVNGQQNELEKPTGPAISIDFVSARTGDDPDVYLGSLRFQGESAAWHASWY